MNTYVRGVIEDRISQGIKDAVVYAAKKYLGVDFLITIATIAYRIASNFSAITSKLGSVYDIYQIASCEEDYFNMGYLTGDAAVLVFY